MQSEVEETQAGAKRARMRLLGLAVLALVVIVLVILYLSGGKAPDVRVQGTNGLALTSLAVIEGPGEGANPRFEQPLGVAIADDGTIYVADSGNDRICAFDEKGDYLREWGGFGLTKPLPGTAASWSPGRLNYPTGVDVGDDGLIYVADFHNDQVSVFEPTGGFVRAFPDPNSIVGKGGSGKDGRGIAVTDVSQAGGYVAMTDTFQVFVFTAGGTFVRQFGKPGSGLTDLDHPAGVAVTDDGIFVADTNHRRILAFSVLGEPRWSLGEAAEESTAAVVFGLPRGVAPFGDDHLLVADPVEQALVLLTREGLKAGQVGARGTDAGFFNFPTDVDARGDIVVVADKENDRVQIMRLEGVDGSS